MDRFNGRSARRARRNFSVPAKFCEHLERRVLLSGDPVIVLVKPITHYSDILTIPGIKGGANV